LDVGAQLALVGERLVLFHRPPAAQICPFVVAPGATTTLSKSGRRYGGKQHAPGLPLRFRRTSSRAAVPASWSRSPPGALVPFADVVPSRIKLAQEQEGLRGESRRGRKVGIEGSKRVAAPGRLVHLSAGSTHRFRISSGGEVVSIIFLEGLPRMFTRLDAASTHV
jgi:hypothetical protein